MSGAATACAFFLSIFNIYMLFCQTAADDKSTITIVTNLNSKSTVLREFTSLILD